MLVGQNIWISQRVEIKNETKPTFGKPFMVKTRFNYFTVMPLTSRGYAEVMKYGEDLENTWTAIANSRAFGGKIKVGDVLWIDGEKPDEKLEEQYGYGCSANAVVKSVSCVNHTMNIVLSRNKDKISQ